MNEPAPTATLIDLHDTILEYDGSADRAWRSVIAEFAYSIPGIDIKRSMSALHEFQGWYWGDPERHRTGRLNLELARREMVSGTFDLMGLAASSLAEKITESYAVQRDLGARPFPGAVETLAYISAKGTRMTIVTDGTSAMQ